MSQKKAIVIGSGIAGLAAAIRLSAKGYSVDVHEKNTYPGGKLSHFERDGFQFDAGPSLFTQPHLVTELFTLCGKDPSQYFNYTQTGIACRYFFESGTVVNAYTKVDDFAEEMKRKLGEDKSKVIAYLETSKNTYEQIGNLFLDYPIKNIIKLPFRKIIDALKVTKLSFLFSSLSDYNVNHFSKPETIQIFNRFATYNGSNPYKCPAMLSMIPHLEQNEGTFYPYGGMVSITNALYKLALDQGVNFKFESTVSSIKFEGHKAKGIIVNGKESHVDLIVSNMDVYYTYKYLLNDLSKAKDILRQERSSSAIIFYWGMNAEFSKLDLHNIFFSDNYKDEFDNIFEKKSLGDDPTIYINITSKMESSQAPDGCENWFVMVNAPHDIGQDWQQMRAQCRKNIISKLNRLLETDLEKYIKTEDFLDPATIDLKTSSYTGSLYGTSSNSKWAAFMRHPNKSQSLDNLYFVGGSVHPGGGIPLCLRSAKIVSELVG